jgi:cytochrome c-type biogenesis protein CcmF
MTILPDIANFFLVISIISSVIVILGFKYINRYVGLITVLQATLVTASFSILIHSFIVSDLSVLLVFKHSHQSKPLLYKVAGSWGNHEGSMLMWVWQLTLLNSLFVIYGNYIKHDRNAILFVQQFITLGLLLFVFFTSNPFVRLPMWVGGGLGLNPLLQDIGLAIHPPVLYFGYVICSLIASIFIVGLVKNKLNKEWLQAARPWILMAWGFLTAGVALGSWWAYRELGWGGFWFWDPVESASLLPWLPITALMHTAIASAKLDVLKPTSVFLSIIAFVLSLFGTFLVRSGILLSVHTFASDPGRAVFVLTFMSLITVVYLGLFAYYAQFYINSGKIGLISRENAMLLGTILLFTATVAIVVGLVYPLFYKFYFGKAISIGSIYYNTLIAPIFAPLLIITAVGSRIEWITARIWYHSKTFIIASIISCIIMWMVKVENFTIFAGLFLVIITVELLRSRIVAKRKLSVGFWRMFLGHLAIGMLTVAINISANLQQERELVVKPGTKFDFAGYDIKLDKIDYDKAQNYFIRRAYFDVSKDGKIVSSLRPESRFYPVERSVTAESAIYTKPLDDLYIVIGDYDEDQGAVLVKLYHKPMMNIIWLSAIMMFVAGFVLNSVGKKRNA